ncbi:MAG: cysteine hydrolase family protein [Streptosporangiales bacterium]
MTETPTAVDPQHTALLVMDYQPSVLGSLDGAEDLLGRAARALAAVRRHGGHVGYVRVGFDEAEYDAIPSWSAMAGALARAGRALRSDSPASAVDDHVAPQPGDIVVRKTRVGAFSTTDLAEQLRDHDVTTLLIAGVATSGVVLSTVRDAADRDYRVIVVEDACADRDPDVHQFLIGKIFPRQAEIVTVDDLDGLLAAAI